MDLSIHAYTFALQRRPRHATQFVQYLPWVASVDSIFRCNLCHVFCVLIKGTLDCVRVGINRTKIPFISVSSTQTDIDRSLKVLNELYVNTE